jgi:uncharacterized protein YndB with AHSA1/START domain
MSSVTKERTARATLTTPADRMIRIERDFDAPRSRVWRAMTEPHLVAQWWGRGHELDVEALALEPGGRWRFVEHAPDGTQGFEGHFREVVPEERLTFTLRWDGMPAYPFVEHLTLEELGENRTRVVSEILFFTSEERDAVLGSGMEEGMNQSYAELDRLLTSLA